MIAARVVRRFNVREKGTAKLVELARVVDVPAVPPHGTVLMFEDGTEAGVAATRMLTWASPRAPGVYPASLEIKTATEPGGRLEAARKAGWAGVEETAT